MHDRNANFNRMSRKQRGYCMKTIQKITSILVIMFVFACCSSVHAGKQATYTPSSTDTIKIASFNIQVFGKTKAEKNDVMEILSQTIAEFDIVAIQEIRDKSGTAIEKLESLVDSLGTDYEYILGPRLGRTSSKEQYAYIYRVSTVKPFDSYTFDDCARDMFHREPYIAYFKAIRGNFDFVLVNIHTDPDEATEEIEALPLAIRDARKHFKDPDIIALGDFNGDCSYFREGTYPAIFPSEKFMWIVSNSADTTVSKTDCTYDRIVATVSAAEDYTGKWGVYRFDRLYGLTNEQAKRVSDHYPVWAEFYINRDSD